MSLECYKDWTLLSVGFELHLLAHALKKDVNDPERPGFVDNHLAFYYNKYCRCKGFADTNRFQQMPVLR